MDHLVLGQRAETIARCYLEQKGLSLLTSNYRCRLGEIDLIMRDRQILVFVEVRYRVQQNYGSGAESITFNKRQKIIKAAQHYLISKQLMNKTVCRFDVVTLTADINTSPPIWIKDAFQVQ